MKNLAKLFGIIALVAAIGFSMASCGDGGSGPGPNPGPDVFAGTWTGPDAEFSFLENMTFTTKYPNGGYWMKGTWNTENPNKLNLVITHMDNYPGVTTSDDLTQNAGGVWKFTYEFLSKTSLKLHDIDDGSDMVLTLDE